MDLKDSKIAIIGCGLVGSNWATMFASAGYRVEMFDISEEKLQNAIGNVEENLRKLDAHDLRRGLLNAEEAMQRITTTTSLEHALRDAIYAQESALEDLDFRIELFRKIDAFAEENTILASSTSTIPASKFTDGLKNRERCLVVHPVNPPLFLPLTELVPAPWTSQDTVAKAAEMMRSIGQKAVRLNKEVAGFAVNRLQYALIAEAWRLIADDVISVQDVDAVMTCGLGPRYAFHGVLETIHLNANGVEDYLRRYATGIQLVTADFGEMPKFEEHDVIRRISESLNARMQPAEIGEFQIRREQNLVQLAKLKKSLNHD